MNTIPFPTRTIEQLFFRYKACIKVIKTTLDTDCWLWQAATDRGEYKYGVLYINGRQYRAHRIFFIAKYPTANIDNKQLDHLCRTPKCINPEHLEPVTNAGNAARSKRCKLNIIQITEIRKSKISPKRLAEIYGVSLGAIYKYRLNTRRLNG